VLPKLVTPIPGPRSRKLAARLRAAESRNVTYVDAEFPIFWERAEGVNVWDADGNRCLDLTGAFAVAGLGHGAPALREALHAQTDRLIHAMGDVHPTELKVRLCEELGAITFGRWIGQPGKTILANAGFEAVEAALKTSLLHSGQPGVIAFSGAYHGLGYGALGAVGLPRFREPFRAQLRDFAAILPYPNCYRCPFGECADYRLEGRDFPNCSAACLAKLDEQIRQTIAKRPIGCILVEPAQGRGGDVFPPRDFLRLLRRVCDEHKILLILDEIYTGFHRTGKFFACEHSGVAPDIICLGKGLTGGFPLSACVGRREVMDAWPESDGEALHTSTYLGHPLGCAMALAALAEHARPEAAALVAKTGAKLKGALLGLRSPYVGQVRGAGLMLGLELIERDGSPASRLAGAIIKAALRDGLILLGGGPAGNVLSFTPPFALGDEEIAWMAARLQEYLTSLPGSIS
jgi:4-aminobutyrate aminotransferase-like enzyme